MKEKKRERALGIDFGLSRIGLSISDPEQKIALPLSTVDGKVDPIKNIEKGIEHYLKEISICVIGLPLHMDGKESPLSQKTREFAEKVKQAFPFTVIFWDERLSSAHAERSLKERSLSRKKRSQKIDTVAATLILQSFLDSKERS